MAPIRSLTAKALVALDIENDQTRRLFSGHVADLALELVYGLRLAAVRAGVRKRVHPRVFREMKLRAFQEACMDENVIANAMYGGRRPEETVVEAGKVECWRWRRR